jgi:hypothetical protein
MALFLPFDAPIIEATIKSTQPPQTIPHHDVVIQNPDFTIAGIMPDKLQIKGTYQILRVFCLIIR